MSSAQLLLVDNTVDCTSKFSFSIPSQEYASFGYQSTYVTSMSPYQVSFLVSREGHFMLQATSPLQVSLSSAAVRHETPQVSTDNQLLSSVTHTTHSVSNWQIINDNTSYSLANCETVFKLQLESLSAVDTSTFDLLSPATVE